MLSQFFESLNNNKQVKKIKITFKDGEILKITFDYDEDKNHDDVLEAKNIIQIDNDKNYHNINNDDDNEDNENDENYDDDEFEDEELFDVDKDDCNGYIDDDDDDDEALF
jgi:hypothetical protein